jgi:excinuclease ABC subunit C
VFSLQSDASVSETSSIALGQLKIREPCRGVDDGNRCSPPVKPRAAGRYHQAVRTFPNLPGVYIFRDGEGRPLYVGKAKSLDHRIRSYFQKDCDHEIRLFHLIASTRSIETIITNMEVEALDLENRLIKQMRPRYNVLLRDGKTYPYIKLLVQGLSAEVSVAHTKEDNGADYYGPFFPAGLAHRTVRLVQRRFLGRSISGLGRAGDVRGPAMAMRTGAHGVRELLTGHVGNATRVFRRRMRAASRAGRFEEASWDRDCLRVLTALRTQAHAAVIPRKDIDVLGISRLGSLIASDIFQFRAGALAGRYEYISRNQTAGPELLRAILQLLYKNGCPPRRILAPACVGQQGSLGTAISVNGRRRIRVPTPRTVSDRAWVKIANKNAQALLERWTRVTERGVTRRINPVTPEASLPVSAGWPDIPGAGTRFGRRSAGNSQTL